MGFKAENIYIFSDWNQMVWFIINNMSSESVVSHSFHRPGGSASLHNLPLAIAYVPIDWQLYEPITLRSDLVLGGVKSFGFLDFSVHFSSSSLPRSFLTGTTWLLRRAVTTVKTVGRRKDRKPTEWPRWVVAMRATQEISFMGTVDTAAVCREEFDSFRCAFGKYHDASRVRS